MSQTVKWPEMKNTSVDVRLVHYAPGQVRLKVGAVRGDRALARRIESELQAVAGIHSVEANRLTGSLLVTFDDRELRTPQATEALKRALRRLYPEADLAALERQLHWALR
ncbi:MAG: heavy-metal-associated domain-containing protein [Nitrococcus sp.]|nr:heavy-metal-associated domain-containing protein [Nitrococcus sp.]